MKFTQICVLFVGFLATSVSKFPVSFDNDLDIKYERLNMIELVKKHGYPIEEHKITTKDGYILSTYRIPLGKHCGNETVKKPIILSHGLLSSSYDFVIEGPRKSLAFSLANHCYDLWLKNSRGNSVSREHVNLTTKDPQFWDFSWHEMGQYDIPAMIDYVLNATNETSLHYIGHSQGTTEFFVFASLYPEYHKKIVSMHALSPAAFLKRLENPIFKTASAFSEPLEILARSLGIYDLYFIFKVMNDVGEVYCTEDYPQFLDICVKAYYIFAGVDEPEVNKTVLSYYLGHFPSGISTKQLYHYGQAIKSHKFRQYDYGIYMNLDRYGSIFPPEYNVSAINVPVTAYYSLNDNVVHPKDALDFIKLLPNVTEVYEIPFPKFTHIDYVTGTDAQILLYNKIIDMLKVFE